jgi:hypothetical protein
MPPDERREPRHCERSNSSASLFVRARIKRPMCGFLGAGQSPKKHKFTARSPRTGHRISFNRNGLTRPGF